MVYPTVIACEEVSTVVYPTASDEIPKTVCLTDCEEIPTTVCPAIVK
jgi:hypothetical protein